MQSFKNHLKKQIYRSLSEVNEVENIDDMIQSHRIRLNSMAIGPHIIDPDDDGESESMAFFNRTHRGQLRNGDVNLVRSAYLLHDASISSSDAESKKSLHDMSTKIMDNHLAHLTERVDPNHPLIIRSYEKQKLIRSHR